jgi:hypothetical protein
MQPHPDFDGRPLPRSASLGRFSLDILTPADVDEDFAVVVESAPVLQGIFGNDWPRGLTLEKNLADLTRHQREFDGDFAFAWIVRDSGGGYLGCAYLRPVAGRTGAAEVFTWIRRRPDRLELLAAFNAALAGWLAASLPPGYATTWVSNDMPDPG